MSLARAHRSRGGHFRGGCRPSFNGNHYHNSNSTATTTTSKNDYYDSNINSMWNYNNYHDASMNLGQQNFSFNYPKPEVHHSSKKRKFSASNWENNGRPYHQPLTYDHASSTCNNSSLVTATTRPNANANMATTCKHDRATFEDDDVFFMSRDQIENCSPSRKDGIDSSREMHLRYSYCSFLQNVGARVELPQTTIGTAMVLCHRFFIRRSHACHDRYLIATAAIFLAAKSEETPCPLNNVLRASCEILHKQDLSYISYLLPVDWFEQYRERVIEAEQMILTTLNFELSVQHPYAPLTSILNKLGFSQSVLVNLALTLVSEGVYRRLACSTAL
ncbi:unnamed protein product [Ilex paraguariensis]|uniref:Cyclin-like domain-containing protein n=1 Tax=Ilex paraguariensis TaxID=185542 RepID=A0ABC8RC54_9AQUA